VLGGTVKAPALDLVDTRDDSVSTVPLHGVFDSISFAPEGDLAILTYSAGSYVPGLAARNLNEIDVFSLASKSALRMQLDTDSIAPRSVVFAPRDAAGAHQLVAVTFEKGVALFDALHPQRAPRRVSIRPSGSTASNAIVEALFSPDARYLYLRATGMDDVVVIELGSDQDGELTASINFVAGGSGLSDIAVPRGVGQEKAVLALYTGSQEAVLLDARGIEDLAVRLPLSNRLTRILALPDGKALLFDGVLRPVVAWDPETGKTGEAVLDAGFDSVFVEETLLKAVFRHPSLGQMGSGGALSVVSVDEETNRLRVRARAIQLTSAARAFALDTVAGQLYLANEDATGAAYVVRLDLGTLALAQVGIDAPATALQLLPGAASVAAIHAGNDWGDLTFVSTINFDRASAERFADFALSGDADRAQGEP